MSSSPSSMAIKEEPLDTYYHPHPHQQQQNHHHLQHNQNSAADPRDYQQSKLYHPQNGGYYPMYDLNGVEDAHTATATTPTNPVSCGTNFEKEIPYHISGRLNGSLEDLGQYGHKLATNGIKAEPLSQDYNSDGGLNGDQQQPFYNGVADEKVGVFF